MAPGDDELHQIKMIISLYHNSLLPCSSHLYDLLQKFQSLQPLTCALELFFLDRKLWLEFVLFSAPARFHICFKQWFSNWACTVPLGHCDDASE